MLKARYPLTILSYCDDYEAIIESMEVMFVEARTVQGAVCKILAIQHTRYRMTNRSISREQSCTQPPLFLTIQPSPQSPLVSKLSLATKLNPPNGFACASASSIKSSNFLVSTGLSGRSVKSCAKFSANSGSVMSG